MFVVTRHRVNQAELTDWLEQARDAIAPLAAMPGCRSITIGLATDDANLVSIQSDWDGVGSYRRALSNFDVKMRCIPFLSTAIDEPSAFEKVFQIVDGVESNFTPARAFDADEVGLGSAAADTVRHRAE